MSGRWPSANSMSTTGPITCTTLPIFCFAATSVAMFSPSCHHKPFTFFFVFLFEKFVCVPLFFLCVLCGLHFSECILVGRLCAGYHLDDFPCDRRLADLVHVQRERIDDLAGVLRGGVHGRHARRVFGGGRFEQRAINLSLD